MLTAADSRLLYALPQAVPPWGSDDEEDERVARKQGKDASEAQVERRER